MTQRNFIIENMFVTNTIFINMWQKKNPNANKRHVFHFLYAKV